MKSGAFPPTKGGTAATRGSVAAITNNGAKALFKKFSLEIEFLGRRPAKICFVDLAPKVTAQPFFGW
jgi:hypothetical protein